MVNTLNINIKWPSDKLGHFRSLRYPHSSFSVKKLLCLWWCKQCHLLWEAHPPLQVAPDPTYPCLTQALNAFGVSALSGARRLGPLHKWHLRWFCLHLVFTAHHSTGHSEGAVQTDRQGPMALGTALWLIGIGHLVLEFRSGLNLAGPWQKLLGLAGARATCLFGSPLELQGEWWKFIFWGDCSLLLSDYQRNLCSN